MIEPAQASAGLWTAAQATAADRYTIDVLGMPSPVLMERAGLCVSAEVERLARVRGCTKVLVLIGPGNNGGDGLAVARQLHGRGEFQVQAVLVSATRNAAAQAQLELARSHGVTIADVLPEHVPPAGTLVVDAMLGTGSRGQPRGSIEQAIRWLGERLVIAIDIPSGVEVDSGAVPGLAVRAELTVTFQRSKPGLHLTPGRHHAGRVVVADIGLMSADADESSLQLIDPAWVARMLAGLPAAAHKGRRGHVGIIGGTGGTPGAAVLAGAAALRSGAGLVSLAMTDPALRQALIEVRPELMLTEPDDRFMASADVLVVGPGLLGGYQGLAEHAAIEPRPMVWDASALAEFVPAQAGRRILTPHPGEAASLLARLDGDPSWTNTRVQADRRAAAERLAELSEAIVVLKGEGSVVARSVGEGGVELAIATTGGPALATAGSGDVLAGAIAALMGRGLDAWTAARIGVHIHGLAGDRLPSNGAVALDIADQLPGTLSDPASGSSWPALIRG